MSNLNHLKFEIIQGEDASTVVDSFYESDNRSSRARNIDTFLVAFNTENDVLGCVRLCEEEGVFLLRSMLIHPNYRNKGLGKRLLKEFEKQLLENLHAPVYCVPHDYLGDFYSYVGFETIENEAPQFLFQRVQSYKNNGHNCILMVRK